MIRWGLTLQEYDFSVEYIKGKNNISDCLSRMIHLEEMDNTNKFVSFHVEINKKGKNDKNKNMKGLKVELDTKDILEMLRLYHESSGHGGLNTMKYLLLRKYKWQTSNSDINNYIKKCGVCQRIKERRKEKNFIALKSDHINDLWELDLIGPLPSSEEEYGFILTKIDTYSRLVNAFPLKSK